MFFDAATGELYQLYLVGISLVRQSSEQGKLAGCQEQCSELVVAVAVMVAISEEKWR